MQRQAARRHGSGLNCTPLHQLLPDEVFTHTVAQEVLPFLLAVVDLRVFDKGFSTAAGTVPFDTSPSSLVSGTPQQPVALPEQAANTHVVHRVVQLVLCLSDWLQCMASEVEGWGPWRSFFAAQLTATLSNVETRTVVGSLADVMNIFCRACAECHMHMGQEASSNPLVPEVRPQLLCGAPIPFACPSMRQSCFNARRHSKLRAEPQYVLYVHGLKAP